MNVCNFYVAFLTESQYKTKGPLQSVYHEGLGRQLEPIMEKIALHFQSEKLLRSLSPLPVDV